MRKWLLKIGVACLALIGLGIIAVIVALIWDEFPTQILYRDDEVADFAQKKLEEECKRISTPPEDYHLTTLEYHPPPDNTWGRRSENFIVAYSHVSGQTCMDINMIIDIDGATDLYLSPRLITYNLSRVPKHQYCYDHLRKLGRLTEDKIFIDGLDGSQERFF
jgi:hypothetical protein